MRWYLNDEKENCIFKITIYYYIIEFQGSEELYVYLDQFFNS